MKKVFLAILISVATLCGVCGCTCSTQKTTEEVAVEATDTADVNVLDAADTVLVVE